MSDQAHTRLPFGKTHGRLFLVITVVAVIVGVAVRFKGLGTWPFGADEYYFGQSIQNILRSGLPEFPCGGFYVRGIVLEYLAAGLQLLGFSPELAPRAIAAVFSLIALPAVFLLGRRMHGLPAGLLAVVLLSLSVWEVEMARFGRMYAPFQAVFLWYLVYFLRFTVDRQAQALRGMVLLTVLGVLTWEGGVLQIALNLLPPFINHERGRLNRAHWRYLGLMVLLMLPIFLYWFNSSRIGTSDLRMASGVPALPADIDVITSALQSNDATGKSPPEYLLAGYPWLWALGLIPLTLAAWALPWILSFRQRWLAAVGLLVALAAAAAHLFLVVLSVLALMLIMRIFDWRELIARGALRFHAAVVGAAFMWILFGVLTDSWRDAESQSLSSAASHFIYQLFGFPNFFEMVAKPWARAVPWLGLSILSMLIVSAVRVITTDNAPLVERALLIVAVVMLLLVSATDAPRLETRYTFFLYPLLLVIGITVLLNGIERFSWRSLGAPLLGPAVVLGWFALTEDYQPRHLLHVDSPEINFRRDMPSAQRSHYYGRSNIRATAEWLTNNVNSSTDLVISGPGVTALNFYYPEVDFVYVDPSDQRFRAWSCARGTVERWSNLPLVYTMDVLQSQISAHPRTYIVVAAKQVEDFLANLQQFRPRTVWVNDYGSDVIVQIDRIG